jgi:hypothetical protein
LDNPDPLRTPHWGYHFHTGEVLMHYTPYKNQTTPTRNHFRS